MPTSFEYEIDTSRPAYRLRLHGEDWSRPFDLPATCACGGELAWTPRRDGDTSYVLAGSSCDVCPDATLLVLGRHGPEVVQLQPARRH